MDKFQFQYGFIPDIKLRFLRFNCCLCGKSETRYYQDTPIDDRQYERDLARTQKEQLAGLLCCGNPNRFLLFFHQKRQNR